MKPETVLIAHGDEHIAFEISHELESEGFKTVIANDGNEAIAIAESIKPKLIVLGLKLAKRSGFLVIERLRQTRVTCPVVIMTDITGVRHRQYAELLGVAGYFQSDESLPKVVSFIAELLEHSFAQTAIAKGAAIATRAASPIE